MIPKFKDDAIRLLILKTLCWADYPKTEQWALEEAWVRVMRLEKITVRLARQFTKAKAELDLAKHQLESASKGIQFRMAVQKSSDRS